MSPKVLRITGWVLTILLGALLLFSAFRKIAPDEATIAEAAAVGIDAATFFTIGIIETVSLILFIVPRTGVLGTLLLASYMGGAIVTHILHQQPFFMAAIVEALIWITAVIRFPELKQRLIAA